LKIGQGLGFHKEGKTLNADQEAFGSVQLANERKERKTYCSGIACSKGSGGWKGKLVYTGSRELTQCPKCGSRSLYFE
jgi:hypothetical protein